ncbi:MAG: transcriptional regulator [Acidobacteriales bacterium]|nr:transcriptional regulator [Terriglobales bacterium]
MRSVRAIVGFLLLSLCASAQMWVPVGPHGGDVRTLTLDPHAADRILLSTSTGLLYESLDGGRRWQRMARLGEGNDYVIDGVIFHPTRPGVIYAAAWSIEREGGDVFRSADNGRTWRAMKDMHGKSIRALAMAPSDPEVLVAGALDGVFRTMDGGEHWSQISPLGHEDIRNIESLAIDPRSPEIVYAGTWHLPWKTMDGGQNWTNIKNGIVDDSDLFSIIIDPRSPDTVYASACSGIYKSENAGAAFRKVQGIPFSARRTRVLAQDPRDPNIVYAGTTEGLWKTADAGRTWLRITGANLIVNDVLLDPARPGRVLLATDRAGVMASEDSGQTFSASNTGFSHRHIATVLVDKNDPATLYVGLVNDKEFGGVFVSRDSGRDWQQMNAGLAGLDVFALSQTPRGELVAGTNAGVYIFQRANRDYRWRRLDVVSSKAINPPEPQRKKVKGKMVKVTPPQPFYRATLAARVNDIEITPARWYAATSTGLFASSDEGRTWRGGLVEGETDYISVAHHGDTIAASARHALIVSRDAGATFHRVPLPENVTTLNSVAVDPDQTIYIATREGGYRSSDGGQTWKFLEWLIANNLASIIYDEEGKRLLATSTSATEVFESRDGGKNWDKADSGWFLRTVRASQGRVIAATAFDGLVLQPAPAQVTATVVGGGHQD